MKDVYIIGSGQTPVTKGRDEDAHELARDAIRLAMSDAELEPDSISALYVGNMMAGILGQQHQLAALCAEVSDLRGVESFTLEASCGSGGAAVRVGVMAIAGGFHDVVAVCGVERMTHASRDAVTRSLATAADRELESSRGESFISLNAKLMAQYMQRYSVQPADFAPLPITAHNNAMNNPNALLHKPLDRPGYLASKVLDHPLRLMDAPPICDGAAAIILANKKVAKAMARKTGAGIKILASAVASDSLAIERRKDSLKLAAAELSSQRAYAEAGLLPKDIDFFELHDAFTVITALSLEAAGFARPGEATSLGKEGAFTLDGRLPISTMGGLKARGHPVGATGVYQIVEAVQQLTGSAHKNQITNPEIAMTQNIGGTGATVVTHILGTA
jgi:acetyl-CoA C-acetyltransferase